MFAYYKHVTLLLCKSLAEDYQGLCDVSLAPDVALAAWQTFGRHLRAGTANVEYFSEPIANMRRCKEGYILLRGCEVRV